MKRFKWRVICVAVAAAVAFLLGVFVWARALTADDAAATSLMVGIALGSIGFVVGLFLDERSEGSGS